MPKLKDLQDTDSQYDPYTTARDLYRGESNPETSDTGEKQSNTPTSSDTSKNIKDVNEKENSAAATNNRFGYDESSKGKIDQPKLQKALTFAKKRGGVIGLISLFGLGGGILASLFGPVSMLINLIENTSLTSDSSSTSMERRFLKVFAFSTGPNQDPICKQTTKKTKCRVGRISNKALNKLERKGVTAYWQDGTDTKRKYRPLASGYPTRNPDGYSFKTDSGREINVKRQDLLGFLSQSENRKLASKILGRGGAFNLRVKAWAGKHISQKFFKKFNVNRKGGLADGTDKRLRDRIPGRDLWNSGVNKVSEKVSKNLGKAKKGGSAYTYAVAGCIVSKAPKYIAATVAAIQLAQVISVFTDTVASPGGKAKASGVDTANSITGEQMDEIGTLLTEQTPREEDGKLTSALDSAYLLAAMGVNQGRPGVSRNYTPGFGVFTHPLTKASINFDNSAGGRTCSKLMSPAAMYAAMAIDGAVTVAASATVIGGLIKFGISFTLSYLAGKIVGKVAGDVAKNVINDIANSEKITGAQGEALGDVIGIGATSFFAGGGMARSLPVLKKRQLAEWNTIQQENEKFQQEMEVASLSPFDTSSRYTFLGSIFYNTRMAMFANGSYNNNIASVFSNMFNMPALAFASTASANPKFNDKTCNYAADFGMIMEKEADTPAINVAGLPCTGLTTAQSRMKTDDAIDLMYAEGWLDESKEPTDDAATIEDMMESEFIKKDTPLYEFLSTCSDASTGEYLFNSTGCTVENSSSYGNIGSYGAVDSDADGVNDICDTCAAGDDFVGEGTITGAENVKSLEAMSVFLLDYQIAQSLNGEDDEPRTEATASNSDTSTSTGAGSGFRAATYNAYYQSTPTDNQNMVNAIKNNKFEIVGMQEISDRTRYSRIKSKFAAAGYSMYPSSVPGTEDFIPSGVQARGVVYTKDFEIVKTEDMTYQKGVGRPGYVQPARAPIIWFKDKRTGQKFIFLNTHSSIGSWGNEREAQNLVYLETIKRLQAENLPIVFVGDFNEGYGPGGSVYCRFVNQNLLKAQPAVDTSKYCKPGAPSSAIDHILVSPSVNYGGFKILPKNRATLGTDHSVTYADIVIPRSGS